MGNKGSLLLLKFNKLISSKHCSAKCAENQPNPITPNETLDGNLHLPNNRYSVPSTFRAYKLHDIGPWAHFHEAI